MEYKILCLLLALASLSLCTGQGDPVRVKILGSTRRIEKPGQAMRLTCQLNKGLPVILTHTIQWVHVSLANTSHPKETNLTTQQTLTDDASPSDYAIDVKYNDNECNFTLDVKSVKPTNDGIFKCRVFHNQNKNPMQQKEAFVIVVNDVESVALQFDGEGAITGQANDGIQREEGRYGVTCTAYGFNPDASIDLFVGDEQQETGGTENMWDQRASAKAKARRYKAMATAPKVELKAANSGQLLRCVARAGFEGAREVAASVPLTVIALEPNVTCDKNASARPKDMYVKINCIVKHDKVQIDSYSWTIGDSGETIVPHKSSDNYHEIDVVPIDEDTTQVILDLFQVDESHFDTFYFLNINTKSGQKFRTKASLIRLDPIIRDSSAKTTATFFLCWLSVLVSLLRLW